MKILRVFLRRTSQTPNDNLVQIGEPDFFTPKDVDEIHISVLFTWDRQEALRLQKIYKLFWPHIKSDIKVGGPAFPKTVKPEFIAGRYTKRGITRTTRGCNFCCPWCLVPRIEGSFKELSIIEPGNIIQDDNILFSSWKHFYVVCQMLKKQKGIRFLGGLDSRLLSDNHIELLRDLSIKELWLSFDSWDRRADFITAIAKLREAGFTRNQLRCYCLAGFNEPIQQSEGRLRFIYECGGLPFIQLYQPPQEKKRISEKDKAFVRSWSKPAAIKAMMKY